MRALNRKLLRDLRRMYGQVLSIAAVVACGVAAVVAMGSTMESVERARDEFYDGARFADVFASLERAPEPLADRIREIPGVAVVETRIDAGALLDVPGLAEPATGFVQSVPDDGAAALNVTHLRRGRMVSPRAPDEVLVGEHFALANGLGVGDTLGAVLNGRWQTLRIVGVALSPEFVHDVPQGVGQFGDSRHFGILWMSRRVLGPRYGMEGAFNSVAIALAPGASEDEVIARLDALLVPYGGGRAYPRSEQASHVTVMGEIRQLRAFGTVMPAVFLLVAAFLLQIVLSRLVATQRQEIAVLKAFGYADRTIGLHFLGYGIAAVALGAAGGAPLGAWVGAAYTSLYEPYFRLPELRHETSIVLVAIAIGVSAAAAALGALRAIRAAASLPPAEGMRPPSPAIFRPLLVERLGWRMRLPSSARMIARNLERRPLRAVASVLGVAMAAAILVAGMFAFDVVGWLIHLQFRVVERADISVAFVEPRPARAALELAAITGVRHVEPYRAVPVRIRAGHRSRQIVVTGLEADATLRRLADIDGRIHPMPPSGLVLTTSLARTLDVVAGDTVRLEILERGTAASAAVVALLDEMLGINGYMELHALNRLVGEGAVISGAHLALEPGSEGAALAALRRHPGVAGAATRRGQLENFEQAISGALLTTTIVVTLLAAVIAVGVLYNGARIALSERGRELASLRVLGFTRREVAALLLGEQAAIDAAGAPLGLLLGLGLAHLIALGFDAELYRFPVIVSARTYAYAVIVVVTAAFVAGLAVRRRLDSLDMIEVLKSRE
jgi:putative ABC transport system permease protein